MSVMTETAARPFHVDVPEEDLVDLRRRIAATRWPERETVAEQTQGVQLATMEALWGTYLNLIYFNEVDEGNHFAAWQEPELFTAEVRAGSGHCETKGGRHEHHRPDRHGDPPLPRRVFQGADRRSAPAHRGDALAEQGTGH